jgi:Glycosyl transferases group 1
MKWKRRFVHIKWIFFTQAHALRIIFGGQYFYKVILRFNRFRFSQSINQSNTFKNSISPVRKVPGIEILHPRFTLRSDAKCESDFYFGYSNSYKQYFPHGLITDRSKDQKTIDTLSDSSPKSSILILGARPIEMFSDEERKIYEEYKNDNNKILLADHSDILITQNGVRMFEYWLKHVDILVVHNPILIQKAKQSDNEKKVILWPGFPYPDQQYFNIGNVNRRENALLFSGTKYQGRHLYLDYCKKRGLPIVNKMHYRKDGVNVEEDYVQYLELLSSCTLAFVNGYRNYRESLLSFRAVECMLLGTLVLYETGSWIDYFFNPYEHFVPVRGRGDLLVKAEMLIRNQSLTSEIAQRAQEFAREQYSAEKFWDRVFNQAG